MSRILDRRQFTKWCGLTAIGALAGCRGGESDGDAATNDGAVFDAGPTVVPTNRVVRVHYSAAQDWDFSSAPGNRHYDHIDQAAVQAMLEQGVLDLTGQTDLVVAWSTVLEHNNPAGYQPGDTVAIKVNNNNQPNDADGQPNTNPAMINAVISGLKSIGVSEGDISVYDATRRIIARQRDGVLGTYPGVVFLGAYDGIEWDDDEVVAFSSADSQRLPTVVSQATHLINLHLMKGHTPGITGSMKNHFGTIEDPNALHVGLRTGPVLAEIWSNPHISDKSRLLVTEAIFANPDDEWHPPARLNNTDVFPEGTPNSLFLSANPVCLDSVLYDYIGAEDAYNGSYHGPDTWLHVAATDFGLGIHEHGTLKAGIYSNLDFEYQEIEYMNRSLG